jgi:hypothetical protein
VVAATVRSGPEDLPDLKSPSKSLGVADQKPQSPSGCSRPNGERKNTGAAVRSTQ